MRCRMCLLITAEREVAALKAELNTAHDRLAELESEVLSVRGSHHNTFVELGRAKERIVSPTFFLRFDKASRSTGRQTSLEITVSAREDALVDAAESHEQLVRAHSHKCRSLEDKIVLLGADKVRLPL